eukprot:6715761-Prymnesium_polylepis.1
MVQNRCFSTCHSCADYARGSWVARNASPAYLLDHSAWARMGLNVQEGSSHDYGQCSTAGLQRAPSQYEWSPTDCSLLPVDRLVMCSLLRGKQL